MKIRELVKKVPAHISITFIYILVLILTELIFYTLIPLLLNYPPDSINNQFQIDVAGLKYSTQYIMLSLVIDIGATIALYFALRKIDINTTKNANRKDIRRRCMEYPYKIYLFEMIIPSLIVLAGLLLIKTEINLAVRIMIIFLSLATILCVTSLIISKRMYEKTLANTYDESMDFAPEGKRVGLTRSIVMQIFPIFIFSALITSLVGYSRVIDEKGDMLFDSYKAEFKEIIRTLEGKTLKETKEILNNSHNMFLIDKLGNKIVADSDVSQFFTKYLLQKSFEKDGRVYEYYGSNIQAVSEEIEIDGVKYFVGTRYAVTSNYTIIYFLISFAVLFVFNLIASWSISKNISDEIERISERLNKIAEKENIEQTSKLPITTNNEIGDLVLSFNKILDLEKKNISTMERNQEILLEQERLSSLGQLIGGIAHNLKTPIMSIAGALEGLTDLVKEYDDSIGDKQITSEDHHEIAKEMKTWIDKIRPYLSYMTEVIDTVKGQAVSMNASTMKLFKVKELVARTKILLKDELKRKQCTLNLDVQIDENSRIAGEISAIIQVIDNLIINAMESYKGIPGNIDFKLREDDDKIYMEVKDYGSGIPENVQERLFKEMVTSKGKNGTGLGLYMSYSTIKGKFNGDLRYETKKGEGTTFFIELNKDKTTIEE